MAPTQPTHRTSRPTKSILKSSSNTPLKPSKTKTPTSSSSSLSPSTKSDKRRIKHSALLSRITKSQSTTPTTKRRRRPNKKLVATLSSLADALPDTTTPTSSSSGAGSGEKAESQPQANANVHAHVNIIKRKSMKSRPGALRRKQRVDNEERRRWGANVAQMSGAAPSTTGATATSGGDGQGEGESKGEEEGEVLPEVQSRWAALRGFIGQTLERRGDVSAATARAGAGKG